MVEVTHFADARCRWDLPTICLPEFDIKDEMRKQPIVKIKLSLANQINLIKEFSQWIF